MVIIVPNPSDNTKNWYRICQKTMNESVFRSVISVSYFRSRSRTRSFPSESLETTSSRFFRFHEGGEFQGKILRVTPPPPPARHPRLASPAPTREMPRPTARPPAVWYADLSCCFYRLPSVNTASPSGQPV